MPWQRRRRSTPAWKLPRAFPPTVRRSGSTKSAGAPNHGFRQYANDDFTCSFASGSALWHAVVAVPCSVGRVGRIASGMADDLIARAADVALKERRKLILVVRETPLSLIHLENLLAVGRAGAIVLPATPSFYTRPATVDAVVDTVVARVLDQLAISHLAFASMGKDTMTVEPNLDLFDMGKNAWPRPGRPSPDAPSSCPPAVCSPMALGWARPRRRWRWSRKTRSRGWAASRRPGSTGPTPCYAALRRRVRQRCSGSGHAWPSLRLPFAADDAPDVRRARLDQLGELFHRLPGLDGVMPVPLGEAQGLDTLQFSPPAA
jgi:4-hydroxy-3-polyprenylbenzoate decarboxylase